MKNSRYLGVIVALFVLVGIAAYGQSDQPKIGKTGHLTIKQETRVGDAVLPAGEYEVQHRRSATGHFVEFARDVEDYSAGEGLPGQQRMVMAQVPCTMKPLEDRANVTSLERSKNGVATDLRIRGEKVEHVFPAGSDPSAPQNLVEYGGGGM